MVSAPVYRYFTVDLLTNEILEEVPFRGVSYQRALNGAGSFSGGIPTIDQTNYLSLYTSTMPGNTALFVVRNGICVWGGIIWSRSYDVVAKTLSVNASEFPSYFYHRKIWKTYNHELNGTLSVQAGVGTVSLSQGYISGALKSGRSVKLQFADFRYDGIYTIAASPAPTTREFTLKTVNRVADVSSVSVSDNIVTITTKTSHGFKTDDIVNVATSITAVNDAIAKITASANDLTQFSYQLTASDLDLVDATGTATRAIPNGTYNNVNIEVRTDTYDYIRDLLTGMSTDFVSVDFPNSYIEPGVSYALDIVSKRVADGYATITTARPHNLVQQQAVQIKNLSEDLDGEFKVYSVLSPTQFTYKKSGTLAETAVAKKEAIISEMVAVKGKTTLTTTTNHGFLVGQQVEVNTEIGSLGYSGFFNGLQTITTVTANTFTYQEATNASVPKTVFSESTATVGAVTASVVRAELESNVATLTTAEPHGFTAGQSVVVVNASPSTEIAQKALRLSSGSGTATITTKKNHQYQSGDVVDISGLQDIAPVYSVYVSSNVATVKTARAFNFKTGDEVELRGMLVPVTITHKSRTSGNTTLTLSTTAAYRHPFIVGDSVTITDIYFTKPVEKQRISNGVATLTMAANHEITVGTKVYVKNASDSESLISKSASGGIATMTTLGSHNLKSGATVTVTGAGTGFDGEFKVAEPITSNTFSYEVVLNDEDKADADKTKVAETAITGTVTTNDAVYNGDFTVSAVTSTSIAFQVNDAYDSPIVASADLMRVVFLSSMNGTYTLNAVTDTSISYAQSGTDVTNSEVARPFQNEDAPYPTATANASILNATWTVTKLDKDTFKFAISSARNFKIDPSVYGSAIKYSIFNSTSKTISNANNNVFDYSLGSQATAVTEDVVDSVAYAKLTSVYNGTKTILSSPAPTSKEFSFAVTHIDRDPEKIIGRSTAVVKPVAIASTFGPFPGSADIGLKFSTEKPSGINVTPPLFRGHELVSVGEVVEKYASSVNGFDYRIDCAYDEAANTFTKTFMMLPLTFPNPPAAGEVSPVSRYGADKLVFEYPGNIGKFTVTESAENASTRMFVTGNADSGEEYGANIGVATLTGFLTGSRGRKWPLLDFDEKADDANNKTVLYDYARRYVQESAPPMADFAISVNGSLEPVVGSYAPGDWCSIVVNDPFIQKRLSTDLEPRDTVLVRKIEAINVVVPDGVTFPEEVTLTIIPEWEADAFGD